MKESNYYVAPFLFLNIDCRPFPWREYFFFPTHTTPLQEQKKEEKKYPKND